MLSGSIDDDKNKEFGIVSSSLLYTDIGQTYTKDGIIYDKISNGYSWRYRPRLNQQLPIIKIGEQTIDDSSTARKLLATIRVPGGILQKGDTITVEYTLSGGLTGSYINKVNFKTYPSYGYADGENNPYWGASKTGGGNTVSFRISSPDPNIYAISSVSGSLFPSPNPLNMIVNTLGDMDIFIFFNFSGTSSGRIININNVKATFNSTVTPTNILDRSPYRLPDDQFFSNDSPWNLPLPPQTIRGTLNDPMARDIRDKWFGKQNKSGNVSIVMYASVQKSGGGSSDGRAHIPVFQIKDTDPICDVYVKPVTSNIKYHGMYFIKNPTPSNTVGYTYKIRFPYGKILSGQTNDEAVELITPDKRFSIEMGHYKWNDVLKRHECDRLSIVDLYGKGFSHMFWPYGSTTLTTVGLTTYNYGYNMYYRAGGNPFMGGIVRKTELDRGVIEHMLCMQSANFPCRGAMYRVVSAVVGTNTIVVRPFNTSFPFVDYTSIFNVVGRKLRLSTSASSTTNIYTCSGTATYDAATGYTTFTIDETITTTSTQLMIGRNLQEWFEFSYVWPMTARDGAATNGDYVGTIPMGQVFTFESTLDIESMPISNESKIIARAIKKYGLMLVDIAGNTTNLCQGDQDWADQQRINVIADAFKLIEKLVPVLNYNQTLYNQAIADTTISKPKPILPFY